MGIKNQKSLKMKNKKQPKKQSPEEKPEEKKPTWDDILEIHKRVFGEVNMSVPSTKDRTNKKDNMKEVIFIKKKDPPKPDLDEIIKDNPPDNEELELDYMDEDEEEELDLVSPLLPFEEKFYDDEGNFYPDGYYDDEGNVIPGAKKKDE